MAAKYESVAAHDFLLEEARAKPRASTYDRRVNAFLMRKVGETFRASRRGARLVGHCEVLSFFSGGFND